MTQTTQLVLQKDDVNLINQVISSSQPTKIVAEEGMQIALVDAKTGKPAKDLKAKKVADDLLIADENGETLLTIEDYYLTDDIQLGTVSDLGFVEFDYVSSETGVTSKIASESSYTTLVSGMLSDASIVGGISNGVLLGSLGAAALGIAAISSGSSDSSPKLPANNLPVSKDSIITATEDTVAEGQLEAATDADGDNLTYAIKDNATNGNVIVNANGSYNYIPNANFNGQDTFTYTINDGKGGVITQTATITVAAVNDAPVSTDSIIAAVEDTVAQGQLATATDVDGDTLTYVLATQATNGSVIVNADGSYSYTPNANFNGEDGFTYTVTDGTETITQTAIVTVASVNDLPISKDSIIAATEDTAVSGKLAAATDADGDALTYAVATGAANGKVVIGKDGSYTYTPNADFNGQDTFTYTINDGKGGVITQTATITVAAVNDAPVSTDSIIAAVEDTVAQGQLTVATDVDGDTLTYVLATEATNGSVIVNADGSYSYTPNANFSGSDSFTYTIDDGKGGVITQTATITVAAVNDAPVSIDSIIAATEDTVATGQLATATDVDGDTLVYALASETTNGSVIVNADGSYSYTPNANFNGEDSFTYTVTDGTETIIQTATITVASVNDLPVSTDSIITATEDTVATGQLATATDVDGDTLVYALASETTNGSVIVNADGSYSYTPNANFNGTDSFTYTVTDGTETITKTANITVASVNDLPVSKDSIITATEDTVVSGKLEAATDADGDNLTYAIKDNATNGNVIVNADGSYTYTPNANFNGEDSFTYTVTDGTETITQTAIVTVASVNDVPVSKNTAIDATEDIVATGQLEAATDVDGDTLVYALVSETTNGTVIVKADGSYSYTPNANFDGEDSFTYTVTDGTDTITKTATITVASVNDLPVSTDSIITATEDTTATGQLESAADADGDTLTYAIKDNATNGTVTVNADGSYTYTPNADFSGTDSFTYTINDGKGGVITQTATITVAAVNDAPVSTDSIIAATEDTVATGQLATAIDADGDTLVYALASEATNGSVIVNADGSYSYTPNANFNGQDSFTYTVTDGTETIIQTATITVASVNDVLVSKNTVIDATEDTVATGQLATAIDADGDTLVYALESETKNGNVIVNADGSYSYTPNADFSGTDSFTYTIDDGQGGVITQTATITVDAINDAPVSEDSIIAATEDTVATGQLATATDVDGDTLVYALASETTNGSVIVNADGSYTYTPNANFNGQDSFTYTVTDGTETIIQTATITVASVNDLPVSQDSIITATEDTVATGQLEAASDADGDALTYAIATVAANGKVVIGKDGGYSYTPNADFSGTDSFTYTINDGQGGVITQTATITVAAVNDAPVSEDSIIAATEDTVATGQLESASDTDGDTLTYAIATVASNGKVVIGKDGSYSYTPNANFNGQDSFTYTINDGKGGVITQTATVNVAAVNDAPLSENSTIAATEDTVAKGQLAKAIDVDGDTLTYVLATEATNGNVILNADGSYTYTPNADFNGKDTFTYTINDGKGGVITQTATVNVAAVNDVPQITPLEKQGLVTTDINYQKAGEGHGHMALTDDGNIVVAGKSNEHGMVIQRFYPDGSLDKTFGENGVVIVDPVFSNDLTDIMVTANGKILITAADGYGYSEKDFLIGRFNSNGSVDNSFGDNGIIHMDFDGNRDSAYNLVPLEGGRILVTGLGTNYKSDKGVLLTVFDNEGNLDSSFNPSGAGTGQPGVLHYDKYTAGMYYVGSDTSEAALVTQDGNIIVAIKSNYGLVLTKFNQEGELLASNVIESQLYSNLRIKEAVDGKLIIGADLGSKSIGVARFNSDLTQDITFNTRVEFMPDVVDGELVDIEYEVGGDIYTGFEGDSQFLTFTDMELLDDGKILVTGQYRYFDDVSAEYSYSVFFARYNTDGTLDKSFNSEGDFRGKPGVLVTDFELGADGYSVQYDIDITSNGEILLFGVVENQEKRTFDSILVKFDLNGNQIVDFGPAISIKATQNSDLVIKVDNFNFSDSDGDQLKAIIIDALPESGELLLNGVSISTGQVIDVSLIESGQLIYRSETNITSDQDINITYRVQDDGGTENGGVDISEQGSLVIKVIGTNTNFNLEDVVNEHFSESIDLGSNTYYESSAGLSLNFDNSFGQMETLIDSPKIKLPSINDLLDLNSNELIFEQTDVGDTTPSSNNDVTSVSEGATDDTTMMIDSAIAQVQDFNDMQTEVMFHIM